MLYVFTYETGSLSLSMTEVRIAVIPKPTKGSYPFINLTILFSCYIWIRFWLDKSNLVISSIVHPDQNGLMPSKYTAQNLKCLFLNKKIPHDNCEPRVLVSLHAGKAFNFVEGQYL